MAGFRGFLYLGSSLVVSEGGFEPPRAMRPLGPQPSASTKFRHSDEARRILARGPSGTGGSAAPLPGEPKGGQTEDQARDHRDLVEPAFERGAAGQARGAPEHV